MADISISNGEYQINSEPWTSDDGVIFNGQTLKVRRQSSPTHETEVSCEVTVGTYTTSFNITTSDITPDAYTFVTLDDLNLNAEYVSEIATITGINVPVPISVDTGKYAINSGAFTSVPGVINDGDYFELELLTANTPETTTTMTVTTGGYSTTFSVITGTPALIGNEEQSQSFQRNNCASGSSGTFYNYKVLADTYFASSLIEANSLALADISENGQNEANLPENASCILNTVISTLVVDVYDDSALDCYMYIDTAGVDPTVNNNIVSRGVNFFKSDDTAESAYLLASDLISNPALKFRFQANIGKLISEYPDETGFPTFTFRLRGRSSIAGLKNGVYALKYPNQKMIMTGTAGSYVPSITPAGGPPTTNWQNYSEGGADGNIFFGMGAVIQTFTYDRATNTIIVT